MTVRIATRGKNGAPRSRPVWRRVQATPTRSKYFVVTPSVGLTSRGKVRRIPGFYTLTHVPSGFSLIQNIRSVRQGKLIAAVADALPVQWDSLTPHNSRRRFLKLDQTWLRWAAQFNVPDEVST